MLSTIEFQGFTIKAPEAPAEQGALTPHPTPLQIVSEIDQQLVYNEPPSFDVIVNNVPANELVPGTVTFQCYWDTVFNAIAQDTRVTQSVTITSGVTTTDSETETFGMSLGVEGGALAGIKAALSASFSVSETHSVALTRSESVAQTYSAEPGTTLQVWQLHAEYVSEFEKDGKTYRSVLSNAGSLGDGLVLALTFPETAG